MESYPVTWWKIQCNCNNITRY